MVVEYGSVVLVSLLTETAVECVCFLFFYKVAFLGAFSLPDTS